MRFDGFVGNENAKALISSYIDPVGGRLPHAVLIEGPRGSGRRTLARILARAVVCRAREGGGDELPCGICSACVKAMDGNHPDIVESDGGSKTKSFSVDTVRSLFGDAYVMPNEAPRRILIMTDTQTMTVQAQNALLKLMEDPPRHLMMILTCENRSQLLETVRSRVSTVSLGEVSADEALRTVMLLCPNAGEEDARRALAVFGGIIGQAVQGLGGGGIAAVTEIAAAITDAVAAPDEITLMRLTGRLESDKDVADGVLSALTLIFRDALAMRVDSAQDGISIAPDAARRLAAKLKPDKIMMLIQEVDTLKSARERNINYALFLTLMCSRLRTAAGF